MIRPAKIEDCARLAEIHVFGWRSAYRDFVGDDFLFRAFLVERRIAAFKAAIDNRTEETYVHEADAIVDALLTIGNARDEDKGSDCFELWGVYVDPFFAGRGIGTELVGFCLEEAKKRKRREVVLWVFEKNLRARHFYEKLDFQADGARKLLDRFNEYEVRYARAI